MSRVFATEQMLQARLIAQLTESAGKAQAVDVANLNDMHKRRSYNAFVRILEHLATLTDTIHATHARKDKSADAPKTARQKAIKFLKNAQTAAIVYSIWRKRGVVSVRRSIKGVVGKTKTPDNQKALTPEEIQNLIKEAAHRYRIHYVSSSSTVLVKPDTNQINALREEIASKIEIFTKDPSVQELARRIVKLSQIIMGIQKNELDETQCLNAAFALGIISFNDLTQQSLLRPQIQNIATTYREDAWQIFARWVEHRQPVGADRIFAWFKAGLGGEIAGCNNHAFYLSAFAHYPEYVPNMYDLPRIEWEKPAHPLHRDKGADSMTVDTAELPQGKKAKFVNPSAEMLARLRTDQENQGEPDKRRNRKSRNGSEKGKEEKYRGNKSQTEPPKDPLLSTPAEIPAAPQDILQLILDGWLEIEKMGHQYQAAINALQLISQPSNYGVAAIDRIHNEGFNIRDELHRISDQLIATRIETCVSSFVEERVPSHVQQTHPNMAQDMNAALTLMVNIYKSIRRLDPFGREMTSIGVLPEQVTQPVQKRQAAIREIVSQKNFALLLEQAPPYIKMVMDFLALPAASNRRNSTSSSNSGAALPQGVLASAVLSPGREY